MMNAENNKTTANTQLKHTMMVKLISPIIRYIRLFFEFLVIRVKVSSAYISLNRKFTFLYGMSRLFIHNVCLSVVQSFLQRFLRALSSVKSLIR